MGMEISTSSDGYSLQQALGVAALRKSMNQDKQTMTALLNDMTDVNAKTMEQSVTPGKGSNIDIRV